MKKIITVVTAVLLLTAFNAYAADKVGFINVPKLLANSAMGKVANEEIKKMGEAENIEISKRNKALDALKEKFRAESQDKDANKSGLKILLEEIQLKDKDLKAFVDDAKEKIGVRANEHLVEILTKADPVLKEIAQKRGYSIILKERNTIAYLNPSADVTDEVIGKLDKMDQ